MKFFGTLFLFGAATCLLGQSTPPPASSGLPPQVGVKMEVENPGGEMPQVPPDRVIITVGDVKITAGQFDMLIDTLDPRYRQIAHTTGRKQFADNIVQMLTLAQEAQRRKLTETPDFKSRVMLQNANLMASLMVEQITKSVLVSDEELKQYYTDHKADYDQVLAKHILIRFQGSQVPVRPGQKDLSDPEALVKAQEICKKLKAGADFAALAKEESDDAGSGSAGGALPAFHHGQMVPSFETAAFALKPGEISEPVKSQFGYHIILVVSHDNKSFDDVKADIEKTMKPQQQQKVVTQTIDALEKSSPPVLDAEFFAPPKTPVPPAGKAPDKQ